MYGNEKPTAMKESAPYYIELAEKAFNDFIQMDHKHQVEAFKYFQKKLCDARLTQNEQMQKDLESHACDVKEHYAGTEAIAKAL